MLQVTPAAIMAAHHATGNDSVNQCHETQSRIAFQITGGGFTRVSLTKSDSACGGEQPDNAIIILDCHISNVHDLLKALSGRVQGQFEVVVNN
jgi:hypothetical protein